MAEIENSIARLALSGTEVKQMTKWGQSMVNDYLGIQESLRIIARELDALTNFITPTTLDINVGGPTIIGDVTDVQVLHDGNELQVQEAPGAFPGGGFDLDFTFEGVETFNGVVTFLRYQGGATHVVTQRLHDFDAAADDPFILIPTSLSNQYRTILIPDDGRYIDANNEVRLSIVHESAGSPSHNMFVEYIALIGLEV